MVKVCCIGAGHVGGPTMAVIALKCPEIEVAVVDISASRIAAWNSDNLPIYEPGLDKIVNQCKVNNNLLFSTDVERHVSEADIVFVSVNTPAKTTGCGSGKATDLTHWESAARTIAKVSTSNKIVVEKSTVPVRTAEAVERILSHRSLCGARFQVVSNPGFLAQGTAVCDLLEPDRVLLGGRDTPAGREAVRTLGDIYSRWVPQEKILTAGLWSAELSKLAANAFLAQRISSVNAVSALCEATGADICQVALAVGRDSRVGPGFLEAGVGFGGPRLQKDVLSLVYICECMGLGEVAEYWRRVVEVNEYQKSRFVRRVVSSMFGTAWGKKVAVLGLAFKKDTGDTRESPAVDICRWLMADGARLSVYDPRVSGEHIKRDLAVANDQVSMDQVSMANDAYEATREAHGICILTEWDEFKSVDYKRVFETMKKPAFVFDGRNVVDIDSLRHIGFIVYSVGKPLDPWFNDLPAMP